MVSNKVFLDTSFLVSLFISVDSNHEKARSIWNKLNTEKPDLFVSNYVMLEFYTILSQRLGKAELLKLNKGFSADKLSHLHITEEVHDATTKEFIKLSNKNISFVDLSSFVACKWHKVGSIVSLDKHFVRLSGKYRMKLIS